MPVELHCAGESGSNCQPPDSVRAPDRQWRSVSGHFDPGRFGRGPAVVMCANDFQDAAVCWGTSNTDDLVALANREFEVRKLSSVSVGLFQVCAITDSADLLCVGNNQYQSNDVPINVPFGGWQDVAAYYETSCGISKSTQALHCWGDGGAQTMGIISALPEIPDSTFAVAEVQCGYEHACIKTGKGRMYCWGNSQQGQSPVPSEVATSHVSSISAGNSGSCGIFERINGSKLVCFGWNFYGQMSPPQDDGWESVSVGYWHSCGILKNN